MTGKRRRTMIEQEFAVAESPQHANAGQTGITGCGEVNIAVANVNGRGPL